MFRDHEALYLVLSVVIALSAILWVLWYETAVQNDDSLPATITAVGHGVSAAVAISIFTLASWEVIVVIARRSAAREAKKLSRTIDAEWTSWLESKQEAEREGRDFNEPSPSERRK